VGLHKIISVLTRKGRDEWVWWHIPVISVIERLNPNTWEAKTRGFQV
jgi:hypothetical protein